MLKGVQAKTQELNDSILPKDVKVRPFYDRSDLVALTTHTVEDNLLRGIVIVIVILIFFLYDFRAGLIVAITIPLSLLFAFICLDLKHIPANLLSIGAIDFGIIVDCAVVMVENVYRQLALRHGTEYDLREVVVDAAAEVDRPILFAVAVIIAGFLPIYALAGPSGKLFQPMADTTIFAVIGSFLLTVTLLPVLCVWLLRGTVRERRNPVFEWMRDRYERALDWSLQLPVARDRRVERAVRVVAAAHPDDRRRVHAEARRGRALGALDDAVHDLVRGVVAHRAADSRDPALVPGSDRGGDRARTSGRWHGPDRILQRGVLRRAQAVRRVERRRSGASRSSSQAIDKKLSAFPGITFNYTQPAEDAVNEAETGLKSSLDVKLFGDDLATLESKGREVKQVLDSVRGINQVTLVQELGQPSLTVKIDRAKIARYGVNVADVNALIEAAVGGNAATTVAQGERTFDLVVRLEPQVSRDAGCDRQHSRVDAGWAAGAAARARRHSAGERRVVHLPAGQLALHWRAVLGERARSRERGEGGAGASGEEGAAAARIPRAMGRRVRGLLGVARAAAGGAADHARADLSHPLRAVQQLQVPGHHRARRRALGADRGNTRAQAHGHAVLGELGDRLSRAVRRERADRGCLHLVRERAAASRGGSCRMRSGRRRCSGCVRS